MNIALRAIGALAACALSTAPLAAQSSIISYQGRLQIAGMPVNGGADLSFSLFNAASGGSQSGTTQSFSNVSVVDGLIALELNFGTTPWATGSNRFLEIGVRSPAGVGAFVTLSPRQRITSAPYAITTHASARSA